jgi:protease II
MTICVSGCATPEPELIPREVLFGNPIKTHAQISPDGKMMAYLAPVNNVLNVWVKTIGKEDDKAVTKDEDRGLRRYFWAADSKHIMYLQDVGGNENWRLYAVALENDEIKDLTPYEEVQVQIVARDKHFPSELLIGMNKEDPNVHDVYHLDLTSGELELVAKNPGNISSWLADANMEVRCAMVAMTDGSFELMLRETEEAGWEKLLTWGPEDNMTSWPVSFSKDGKSLYLVDSRNANTGRLIKMTTANVAREVIAEDPQYDVSDVMVNPDSY